MSIKPTIVIDPGHGGSAKIDGSSANNAVGGNGLLEKNLTLDVARRVATNLSSLANVILTRTGDSNLGLAARAKVARDNGASHFLSIHFNGFGDTKVDGTEVWVARDAGRGSRSFAKDVLDSLLSVTHVKDRGVREGNLGVLLPSRHSSTTNACLVEVAFLTNPSQARQLEDEKYRQNIADAIIAGIRQNLATSGAQSFDYDDRFSATVLSEATTDEIAAELGYGSVSDYVSKIVKPATLFGLSVGGGLHPDFYKKLQQAEKAAALLIHADGSAVKQSEWGITNIGGCQPRRRGWHPWGLAVDIDYIKNPYVMHESGEPAMDKLVAPIYHRIARLIYQRDSVIPKDITETVKGESKKDRTSRLYDSLLEEHEAMKTYFRAMPDEKQIEKLMSSIDKSILQSAAFWKDVWGIENQTPTAAILQQIMMRDYVALSGKAGAAISGQTYPDPKKIHKGISGDPPFVGRSPENGFLTLRKEIVMALTGAGLRWGAIDFGASSGDVMHFDDGDGAFAGQITKARKKLNSGGKGTSTAKNLELAYESDWYQAGDSTNGNKYSEPLGRKAMTASDVRWAADNVSPDYRHLNAAINTTPFELTHLSLERLCEVNNFDVKSHPKTPRDEVLFALRGCQIADGKESSGGFVTSVKLVEAIPDHQQSRCVVGVWKRSTKQVAVFLGSTVPYWKSMENYRQDGEKCNMLSTGRYIHTVGTHRAGHKTLEIKGALIQQGAVTVVRTLDNLTYEVTDTWDFDAVGDNIHPTRHPKPADKFSSEGCVTVVGTYDIDKGTHTGLWSEFRKAAGLTKDSAPSNENGYTFVFVLLTGREARLINEEGWRNLTRLRYGSSGVDVENLQLELKLLPQKYYTGNVDGDMRNATTGAYIKWQQDQDETGDGKKDGRADGIVTPTTAKKLGIDIIRHVCLVNREASASLSNGGDYYTAKAGAHYEVRADILVTRKLEEKMEELAKKVFDKTGGHKITYSSGYRTPYRQAKAMYDNAKEKGVGDFDKYTAKDLAKEIKDAYLADKDDKDKAVSAMTEVIEKQVARGKYISLHLRSGAVDISSVDKSHYDTIKKLVSEMSGSSLNEGDHLHVQF